ncbi:MAG: hypothetical protein QOF21_3081 [Actinomycetota bacterium]
MRDSRLLKKRPNEAVDRNGLISDAFDATERGEVAVVSGSNDRERRVTVRDRVDDCRDIRSQVQGSARRRTRADRGDGGGRDDCGEECGDASTHYAVEATGRRSANFAANGPTIAVINT